MQFITVGKNKPEITQEMANSRTKIAVGYPGLANVYTAFYDQGRQEFTWVWSYTIGTPWG
jgi:hypothetical protein